MKVNVLIEDGEGLLDGYDNLTVNQLTNLPDSACDEIYAGDIVDILGVGVCGVLVSKLRHGGVISVTGNDLNDLSRMVYRRIISEQEVAERLQQKHHIGSLVSIQNLLGGHGLSIIGVSQKEGRFSVRARRP